MINIYLYRNSLNHTSREDLYLIVQTTRIINSSKQFYLISDDLFPSKSDDELKAKRYFEATFHQASALIEVLYILNHNLLEKYNGHISCMLVSKITELVGRYKNKSDIRIEVLKDIRNKHGYHIGFDDNYIGKYITNKPSRWDLKIGIGRSTIEQDIIFTLDNGLLITYLMDKYALSELDVYALIKKSIHDYTEIINSLFRDVLEELITDKFYIVEDNK